MVGISGLACSFLLVLTRGYQSVEKVRIHSHGVGLSSRRHVRARITT